MCIDRIGTPWDLNPKPNSPSYYWGERKCLCIFFPFFFFCFGGGVGGGECVKGCLGQGGDIFLQQTTKIGDVHEVLV